MSRSRAGLGWLTGVAMLASTVGAGDPAQAEQQYRIARRLAVDRSPQAAAALQRVVELDPGGPWADDALLEQVLLEPVPDWPEQVDRLATLTVRRLIVLVDRVVQQYPDGDRAIEARYRRALLLLEPVPGYDRRKARADFVGLATGDFASWSPRARYALGWLHESEGDASRAAEAYQRVVIDDPDSAASRRAAAGLGRLLLRDGDAGRAARWLQEAIDAGVDETTRAADTREAAVRVLLDRTVVARGAPEVAQLPLRTPSAIAAAPKGGVFVGDRREGVVLELGPGGKVRDRWASGPLDALASDRSGRAFVASSGALWRLDPGGKLAEVAKLGDFDPPSALAVGAASFWVVDRRGQRLGRVEPGRPVPILFWEARGAKLASVAWDGRRVLALDVRGGNVVSVSLTDRTPRPLADTGLARPSGLAAGPAGHLVLADGRAGMVRVLAPDGSLLGAWSAERAAVERLGPITMGLDGSLNVLDEVGPRWVNWR